MHRGFIALLLAFVWLGTATLGCAAGPGGEAVSLSADESDSSASASQRIYAYEFERDDYDAVFDAAVDTLRDAGYRIARRDRRFGVITTYPEGSPTMFEPWVAGNTTGDLARRSTFNELRRSVTVRIDPADGATSEVGYDYRLSVEVGLERRQTPDRYLTHSARGQIASRYRDVPAHLAQRGIPGQYWEAAGRDPQLAERLLLAIGALAEIPQSRGEHLRYDDD